MPIKQQQNINTHLVCGMNQHKPRCEVSVFSVDTVHFALYLQHLAEKTKSKSAAEGTVKAIGWINQFAGQPPTWALPFIQTTLLLGHYHLYKPLLPAFSGNWQLVTANKHYHTACSTHWYTWFLSNHTHYSYSKWQTTQEKESEVVREE